jgi:hypothetical protein
MTWQAQCYPRSVDELKPVLALVRELGADHLNLQADVRPYTVAECIPYIEGWRGLASEAGVELHIETHRDRMTTDLFFTLHLLDRFPDLRFTADISHYVVGREFAWPIAAENHAMIHRILDNSWFMGWWDYAIRSWRARAGPDETLTFLCELGPSPYAITGADGYELSDRWQEAIQMKEMIRSLWRRIEREG